MPRIDPLQLLTCLGVLLKPNGGIKGKEEVAKLASLMTKFSKKLVSKCIYVQILKVTDPELLDLFMTSGGWNLTHMWLSDAVEVLNWPLINELLDLLTICPVTVDRLRENTIAKILKTLSKDAENECVREKATQVVGKWTLIIKEGTQDNDKNVSSMVKAVNDDKDISSKETDTTDIQMVESDVVEPSKKAKRKGLGKKIRKRTKRMMNLRDTDGEEGEENEDKNEKENNESKSATGDDINISEETRSQWKSLTPEMRALPVYKIMIRDGKQVLAKVTSGFRAAMKEEDAETTVEGASAKAEMTSDDSSCASQTKQGGAKNSESVSTESEKLNASAKRGSESDSGSEESKSAAKNPKESSLRTSRGRTAKLRNKSLRSLESLSSEDSSVLSDRESGKHSNSSSSGVKSDHRSKSKHKGSKKHSSKHDAKHSKDGKSELKRSKSRDGERDSKHKNRDRSKEGEKDKTSSKGNHDKLKEKGEQKKNKEPSVLSKDKVGKDHKSLEQAAKDKETLERLKLSGQTNLMSGIGKIPKKAKTAEGSAAGLTKPPGPPPPPKEKTFSILENRPKTKTVKTFNSKFRLTGLEEELQPPPPRAPPRKPLPPPEKRSVEAIPPVVPNLKPKLPLPIKRSSPPPADSSPSEKRLKPTIEDMEKTAEDAKKIEKPGGIKLIAPKPKPQFLQESASFMDALTAGSRVEPRKRKRRNSSSKDGPEVKKETGPSSTPTGATSPPTTPIKTEPPLAVEEKAVITPPAVKPAFRFYQDTLETAEEVKKEKDVEEEEEMKVEEPEPALVEEVKEEEEKPNEQTEVVEKTEEETEEKMEVPMSPPIEEITISPKPETPEPQEVKEVRQPTYAAVHKKDGTAVRSVLVYHRGGNGKKKSVKWKEEPKLEEVFMFELDETERTNVSRTFMDMKHLERIHEAQAFQLARKIAHDDTMEEKTVWQRLIPISLDNIPNVEVGRNSVERDVQYAREKNVLPATYYSKTMIPDSPAEADSEHHPMTDPVTIPLEDVTGNPESVNDHRSVPWPEPKVVPPRPPSPPGAHGFLGPPHHMVGPGFPDPSVMNPMMVPMGPGGSLLGPGPGPGPMVGPMGGPVPMGGPIMGGDWRSGDGTVYAGIPTSMPDPFLGGPPHGMGMPDEVMPYPLDNGPPEVYVDEGMMGPDDRMFMGPEEFPLGGPGVPFHFRGGPGPGPGPYHGMGGGRGKMGPRGMGPRSGNRGGPPRGGGFRGGPARGGGGPNRGRGPIRGGRGGQWQENRGHPGGRDRSPGDRGVGRGGRGDGNRGFCKHFRGGFCRNGDNCPFLHQNAQMY